VADPPVFSIDAARAVDGRTTISVAGELDLANAAELAAAITQALQAGDVTLDLRELTFMDSAGVRGLNTALREAADANRDLRVTRTMHPSVEQILNLTGMLGLLRFEEEPAV
jgi:anti-anti-sigma factor